MYRVAFNPALPVVAAQSFTAAGKSFKPGDRVDWRSLGVTELDLFAWWRSMLVVHPIDENGEPVGAEQAAVSETPKQQRGRKRKSE